MSALAIPPAPCSLEMVLAAERVLDEFVAAVVRRNAANPQVDPTESEQYLYNMLSRQLQEAKAGYRELCRLEERDNYGM